MKDYQGLFNLVAPIGAKHKRKRVGRGHASGWGKTSGRGHKGQKARKGGGVRPGFEGGQITLAMRLPKRGFTNIFAKNYEIINIGSLAERFPEGGTININDLIAVGLISKPSSLIKILGQGDISTSISISAHKFSKSAEVKIKAAGGEAVIVA